MTQNTPDPYFDDQGSLHGHSKFADALAGASAEGKLLFIEFGRGL